MAGAILFFKKFTGAYSGLPGKISFLGCIGGHNDGTGML